METLLMIMLYLCIIVSPGSYYQSEIDTYEQQNQQEINAVYNDPFLLDYVQQNYQAALESVLIINDNEEA